MSDLVQFLLYFVGGSIFFRWLWLEEAAYLERRRRAVRDAATMAETAFKTDAFRETREAFDRLKRNLSEQAAAKPTEPTISNLKTEVAALEAEVLRRADRITERYGVSVERVDMAPDVIQNEAGRLLTVRYRPSVETIQLLSTEAQP